MPRTAEFSINICPGECHCLRHQKLRFSDFVSFSPDPMKPSFTSDADTINKTVPPVSSGTLRWVRMRKESIFPFFYKIFPFFSIPPLGTAFHLCPGYAEIYP